MSRCKLEEFISYEQPAKYIVDSDQYDDSYETPVLTAGKSFILGYTDEKNNIFDNLPVIIFDDFTTSVQFVDFPFKVKSSAMKLLKNTEQADIKYCYYLLKFLQHTPENHKRQWLSATSQKTVDLPTIEEQKNIVKKLDKILEVIDNQNKQLELLDEAIKARFVEMFGDPVHSEKYGTRKLSSCVAEKSDMVDGPFGSQVNTKVDYIENGEIPVIRTVNVKMMSFSPTDLKYMTREKYETVIRSQVLPGDVILTKVGTIGNVCIFPNAFDEAVLSTTGSCRIRVDNSVVNTQFFAYNLMYLKGKLLEIASAGVQPFLNMNHVKNIDILDVSLEKQKEFADFVKEIDKSRLLSNHSLSLIKSIIF